MVAHLSSYFIHVLYQSMYSSVTGSFHLVCRKQLQQGFYCWWCLKTLSGQRLLEVDYTDTVFCGFLENLCLSIQEIFLLGLPIVLMFTEYCNYITQPSPFYGIKTIPSCSHVHGLADVSHSGFKSFPMLAVEKQPIPCLTCFSALGCY